MDNPGEIMRLCRLCLVKDQVNIPIFDEQGDIRQIFLKISSCLPVKVSKEDQLPKSICDGCSNKLDLLYEFRNSSVNAEKALLSWVSQAIKDVDETVGVATQPVAKPSETQVKEETLEECHAPLVHSNDSMDAQESAAFDENSAKEESDEPPPPKRARRTAAVKAQINIAPDSDDEDDDDLDIDAEPLTKIEDESDESDGDEKDDPSYPDVPGTSADDQPGPSGVGKDGVEAPYTCWIPAIKEDVDAEDDKNALKETITIVENPLRSQSLPPVDQSSIETVEFYNVLQTYLCGQCLKSFRFKWQLNQHEREVHTKNRLDCPQCTKSFKTRSALNKHIRRHNNTFRKQCETCPKLFFDPKKFDIHMKLHRGEFTVQCNECDMKFVTKTQLKNHLNLKHERPLCSECGKTYSDKWSLERHMICHAVQDDVRKSTKFKCEHCEKKFDNENSRNRHMYRQHRTGLSSEWVCDICGKTLACLYSLKSHKLVHSAVKPFECNICNKRFLRSGTLRSHRYTHTGEQPYKCELCDRRFTYPTSLKNHVETMHSISMAFVCVICQIGFSAKDLLDTHNKDKHTKS